MTESTFPFQAEGAEPEAANDRRKLAVVAGAGALAVAVLGYFVVVPVLTGGSDDASSEASVVRRRPPVTAPKAPAKAAAKPVAQPATYADTSARQDPFKPLVLAPVVVPAAPVAVPGVAAPPATGTGTGTGTTPGGTAGGGSVNVGGQRVALVHVYAKDGASYAQTKVGDTVHTPKVGDVFAGTYKLLAVSGKTATYLYGDEQFTLSEGQEVLK